MNEFVEIKKCLQLIEIQLQWKSAQQWTDSNYRKLSLLIKNKSGISISHQTLKRLFGKVNYKDFYNPQQATKDALAKFLDYSDWNDFITNQIVIEDTKSFKSDLTKVDKPQRRISFIRICLILSCICIFGLLILLIVKYSTHSEFKFLVKNPIGIIPHTIEFDYDISKLKDDSVFLDFNYRHPVLGYQKILLDKNKNIIRHCFQIPNCYRVKLIANHKIIAQKQVQICSQGWITLFKGSDFSQNETIDIHHQGVFQYGLDDFIIDTVKDGMLYFSPKTLLEHGMESRKVYYLESRNIRNFNAIADYCQLEIRFKNDPQQGGISCFDSKFALLGKKETAEIIFMQKGCSRWSAIHISDFTKDGQYDDLTSLSRDLNNWETLKVQIKNKKAKIWIDDIPIYCCSYTQPIDSIKGLILLFKGSGQVDYVKLRNEKNQLVFNDDFN